MTIQEQEKQAYDRYCENIKNHVEQLEKDYFTEEAVIQYVKNTLPIWIDYNKKICKINNKIFDISKMSSNVLGRGIRNGERNIYKEKKCQA